MTAAYEYKTEWCGGNLFILATVMNSVYAKEGWELVSAQVTGMNTAFIMKRPIKPQQVVRQEKEGKK